MAPNSASCPIILACSLFTFHIQSMVSPWPQYTSHHLFPRLQQYPPYTSLSTQYQNPLIFNFPHSCQNSLYKLKKSMSIPNFYHLSTTFNIKDLSLAHYPKILNEGASPKLLITFSVATPPWEVFSFPHSMTYKPSITL